MATPTSTFLHFDFQPGSNAHSDPNADARGARQQQGQQHPRMRSQRESTAHSRWQPAELRDDTEYAEAISERLGIAANAVRSVQDRLSSISAAQALDIDALIKLFTDIKSVQKSGDIDFLREQSPEILDTLSNRLLSFLKQLSADIETDKFPLTSLNADDIHQLFNGLSAITGESFTDSLLSKSDFNKSRALLRKVTEGLLAYPNEEKLFEKNWDSAQLINGLNWLSRGLKQGILSKDSPVVRQAYEEALWIMANWVASEGERTGPSTLVAPLDTRQLGKCMVQISAVMRYQLIDLAKHRERLSNLVLGLAGGDLLNEFKLWKADETTHQRRLAVADVDSVVVTNISNTIKDCLGAGILRPGDPQVQTLVDHVCRYMQRISDKDLSARHGQRLGNCCNFLRIVFEIEQSSGQALVNDRAAYEKICSRMLGQIPLRAKEFVKDNQVEQHIANLFSFVKAMDRTRSHSTRSLGQAAKSLDSALLQVLKANLSSLHYQSQSSKLRKPACRQESPQRPVISSPRRKGFRSG